MISMLFIGVILSKLQLLKGTILVLYTIGIIISTFVEIIRLAKFLHDIEDY